MKKKIGIIGQFAPPMHGLSKALDTLYNSYLSNKYELTKFDIKNNRRFLGQILNIFKSDLEIYYLTISQSKLGNLRDLVILKLLQLKKKKIIIHLHGGGFRNLLDSHFLSIQKKINYNILGKVDVAIVLGNSLKFNFEGIIDNNKIRVVMNCVDNEFVLDENTFKDKITLFKNKKVLNILYLSNFIEDKGYKYVLELSKHIKDIGDIRFKFLFAGKFFTNEERNEFFKYIDDNKLSNIVKYKGIVYGNEKRELIKESDYFILLSKNEGQPISIIEAASNGLRVITTNLPGINDILGLDEIIVCDKNQINVEQIYDHISREYCNRNLILSTLEKNRDKMLSTFSEEVYLKNLDDVFNSLSKEL